MNYSTILFLKVRKDIDQMLRWSRRKGLYWTAYYTWIRILLWKLLEVVYFPLFLRVSFIKSYLLKWFIYLYECGYQHMYARGACLLDPWELGLQKLWDNIWVLRIEPGSSSRATSALNHWTISLTLLIQIFSKRRIEYGPRFIPSSVDYRVSLSLVGEIGSAYLC